jgi:hypothetical protein
MGDRLHGMARRAVKGGLKGHALRRACPWHATPDATLELTVAGGSKLEIVPLANLPRQSGGGHSTRFGRTTAKPSFDHLIGALVCSDVDPTRSKLTTTAGTWDHPDNDFKTTPRPIRRSLGASGLSATKKLWMVKQRARAHGRGLSLQLEWLGNGHRLVLGCALRGLGGVAEPRRGVV